MLKRLAGHLHYTSWMDIGVYLDDYGPDDQERLYSSAFMAPFLKWIFSLIFVPYTFLLFMMATLSDMAEKFIEGFIDDFSVLGLHLMIAWRLWQWSYNIVWEKMSFLWYKRGLNFLSIDTFIKEFSKITNLFAVCLRRVCLLMFWRVFDIF